MRNIRIGNEGLIRGVKEDDRVVGVGIIDPSLQLGFTGHGAGRIVGEAEIDNVHFCGRQCRNKAVSFVAGEVDDVLVVALRVSFSGATDHDVGIVVDRIDRITDGNYVVQGKDIEDVGAIALGTVGDKHLLRFERNAERFVRFFDDRVDQPVIPLLRAVAGELFCRSKIIDRVMKRFQNCRGQRTGYIANTETDDLCRRIGFSKGTYTATDLREQVAGFQFQVVFVYLCHYEIFLQK